MLFLQVLRTQLRWAKDLPSYSLVSEKLEKMLSLHIIVPIRSMHFEGDKERNIKRRPELRLGVHIKALLAALHLDIPRGSSDVFASEASIALLLEIAIRTVVRDTPQKARMEASWLESLFIYLGGIDDAPTNETVTVNAVTPKADGLLEALLQISIERKLNLSLFTLNKIITNKSAVLQGPQGSCRWTLLAKVLKVDINVLFMDVEADGSEQSEATPARALTMTLFSRLTQQATMVEFQREDYDFIKAEIVIPVFRGFVYARKLSDFLRYWQNELTTFEQERLESTRNLGAGIEESKAWSVWEDDDVLLELRRCLPTSFTAKQVEQETSVCLAYVKAIRSSNSEDAEPYAVAYARMTILEGIIDVSLPEQSMPLMKSTVQLVQSVLLGYLGADCKSSVYSEKFDFRCYRVLASCIPTILPMNATMETDTNGLLGKTAGSAIHELRETAITDTSDRGPILERFLIPAKLRYAVVSIDHLQSPQLANDLAKTMTDFFHTYLTSGDKQSSDFVWDGRNRELNHRGALLLGFMVALLECPQALR